MTAMPLSPIEVEHASTHLFKVAKEAFALEGVIQHQGMLCIYVTYPTPLVSGIYTQSINDRTLLAEAQVADKFPISRAKLSQHSDTFFPPLHLHV